MRQLCACLGLLLILLQDLAVDFLTLVAKVLNACAWHKATAGRASTPAEAHSSCERAERVDTQGMSRWQAQRELQQSLRGVPAGKSEHRGPRSASTEHAEPLPRSPARARRSQQTGCASHTRGAAEKQPKATVVPRHQGSPPFCAQRTRQASHGPGGAHLTSSLLWFCRAADWVAML